MTCDTAWQPDASSGHNHGVTSMGFHRISGTEAFDYADHRLGPAHGAITTFRSPRVRRSWVASWQVFAVLAGGATVVIGHLF